VKKLDESKHFFIDKKIKEEKTKYKREKTPFSLLFRQTEKPKVVRCPNRLVLPFPFRHILSEFSFWILNGETSRFCGLCTETIKPWASGTGGYTDNVNHALNHSILGLFVFMASNHVMILIQR
jgi:hypothetical protein